MEPGRIPNKLKMFRRSSGYSQKKVARMLGLADTSTLSKWEHGISVPSTVQVFRLSRIYRTEPHELFNDLWEQAGSEYAPPVQSPEAFIPNQSFLV